MITSSDLNPGFFVNNESGTMTRFAMIKPDNTDFPAISVNRYNYDVTPPGLEISVYPHFAELVYVVNSSTSSSSPSAGLTTINRGQLLLTPTTSANQLIQVSNSDILFQKAYFYGLKAVATNGSSYTVNTGTVYAGEKDNNGNTYCVDAVTNDPSSPVTYLATPGAQFNLKNFWVYVPANGDSVFVKYQ